MESTKFGERAIVDESASVKERATQAESTKRDERATGDESTSCMERAISTESAMKRERARHMESTKIEERANRKESTKGAERAKACESTIPGKRATDGESANDTEHNMKGTNMIAPDIRAALDRIALISRMAAMSESVTEAQHHLSRLGHALQALADAAERVEAMEAAPVPVWWLGQPSDPREWPANVVAIRRER